ncbi:MAG: Uncharacterized protein FD161_4079 [Limisphaerales bacterium]|nr:MAG: Uncharacterized protein FD161_4079 [Limisphaerales bacterium]KAG0507211.1 MAG: Uncharacterized protein E1N63_3631 [Limisphaerales bacterium]TXT47467.1 MAG: Uncharacterized protein FD140_4248 [Limisphaerales bacterium]
MNTPLPNPSRRRIIYSVVILLAAAGTSGILLRTLFYGSPRSVPHPLENLLPLAFALAVALFVAVVGFWPWLTQWIRQRIFQRKTGRALLWATVALASLVVLFYTEERWRGSRALTKLRSEATARGEKLDLASLAPPPVPEDQNFAMTPLLAWLNDYEFSTNRFWDGIRVRDSAAEQRAKAMQIPRFNFKHDALAGWQSGQRTDLVALRDYYAKISHVFPNASTTSNPAADLLVMLEKFAAELAELHRAMDRPHTRFAWHYGDGFFAQLGPDRCGQVLRDISHIVRLHALAEIAAGRGDAAIADTLLLLRLADAQRGEPFMLGSQHRRLALLQVPLQVIWEGLTARVWTDPQIAAIQAELSRVDLISEWQNATRGEAIVMTQLLQFFSSLKLTTVSSSPEAPGNRAGEKFLFALISTAYPSGWSYQSQVACHRWFELAAPPAGDNERRRLFIEPVYRPDWNFRSMPFDPVFRTFIVPKLEELGRDASLEFPYTQMAVNQAVLACAIERHRLATGSFPETLDSLVPRFLTVVPRDLNAQRLKYRRTESGQFVLYSTGWNGKDDGGRHEPPKHSFAYAVVGEDDWAWPYPQPK